MSKDLKPANPDMVEGYRDGLDPDSLEPGENQSASYKHGFQNGRDDLYGKPRASASVLLDQAQKAMDEDERKRHDRHIQSD